MKVSIGRAAFCAASGLGMWSMYRVLFQWTWEGATLTAVLWTAALVALLSWADPQEGGE